MRRRDGEDVEQRPKTQSHGEPGFVGTFEAGPDLVLEIADLPFGETLEQGKTLTFLDQQPHRYIEFGGVDPRHIGQVQYYGHGIAPRFRSKTDAAEGRPWRSGQNDDVASLEAAEFEMNFVALEIFAAIADCRLLETVGAAVLGVDHADSEIAAEFFDFSVHGSLLKQRVEDVSVFDRCIMLGGARSRCSDGHRRLCEEWKVRCDAG